jgi:hypothetical protein
MSEKERKKQREEEEKMISHEEAVPKLSVLETAKGF